MSKNNTNSKKQWISLEDFENSSKISEQKKKEFLDGVTDEFEVSNLPPLSRRKFLALVSASAALAATACTDYKDKGEIIPYNKKPEDITIGKANYYASTYNDGSGILVKTREGRPIKIDGNPEHPINQGKVPNYVQSAILDLYDPERIKYPIHNKQGEKQQTQWDTLDKFIVDNLKNAVNQGKEIAIISHTIKSPTAYKLIQDFQQKYPTAQLYVYDLIDDQNRKNAWYKCYGEDFKYSINWDKPDIIFAIEADILGTDNNAIENIKLFSKRRNVNNPKDFNKLYAIEGNFTLTGANSDVRIRLNPIYASEFVLALVNELLKSNSASDYWFGIKDKVKNYNLDEIVKKYGLQANKIKELLADLKKFGDRCFFYGGNALSEDTHIAINLLNEILGSTKFYNTEDININFTSYSNNEQLKALVNRMQNNQVAVVIHFDTNPVYHFLPELNYNKSLEKVPLKISLTELENETSQLCDYILPIHHSLESWNDFQTRSSFISLQQPVISPLYDSRQKELILLNWISPQPSDKIFDLYHKYLQLRWENEVYRQVNAGIDFQSFWYSALHDGFIALPSLKSPKPAFQLNAINELKPFVNSQEKYTLLLCDNLTIKDGRYSNNGWLQELPDPISKITWDNYASISPNLAKQLGLKNNDMLEVSTKRGTQTLPVLIQPGIAESLICIKLGYGRTYAGTIGSNNGFDVIKLMDSESPSKYLYYDVKIKKTGEIYKLATTQEHHALDDEFVKDKHLERGIIKEGTLKEYIEEPDFLHKGGHHSYLGPDGKPLSITKDFEYPEVKWGMAIDLNKCVGCGLCITACNVENNVPVVGKDQVIRGREMQWIRVDRYYTGTPEDPLASIQPMLCQHCDNAPCENVCPVVATTHSPDGLNQMVYNRCVGTRYCANNCPYKVRRFNFYDYRDFFANGFYYKDSLKLAHNPEVTVRSRGVMEKCTFCIQRIMEARQEAKEQGQTFDGRNVKTACQEACPADAIVFGNLNDPESEISKLSKHKLGYHILEMLNVRPNITYIAKLRNKNTEDA